MEGSERPPAPGMPNVPPPLGGQAAISRYLLLDRLGSGGVATIYRAQDRQTGHMVALKVLRLNPAADPIAFARFQREARFALRLTHPHIVRMLDYCEPPDALAVRFGGPYLVMEFVPGPNLKQVLLRHHRLAPAITRSIGIQICAALAYAHQQRILHRDIKPQNILLTADAPTAPVKLADFGIAYPLPSSTTIEPRLTTTGFIVGTAEYLAPEQITGDALSPATDLYALGLVLYECLAGRPAFGADDAMAVAARRTTGDPLPPSQYNTGIPPQLEAVIMQALQRHPGARFPHALAMRQALIRCAPSPIAAPSAARTAPSPAEQSSQPDQRRRPGDLLFFWRQGRHNSS
jgi:serine/threonine protein kinase